MKWRGSAAAAARSRSEADWLVGINGTRAMTAFNSRDGGFFLTTVGRVQTPTLSIVVEREEKIRKHVARPYWEVKASFAASAGTYDGKWFDPAFKKNEDAERRADRIWSADAAQAIADAVRHQPGVVTEEAKPSTQACPALYDLTTLQREANSRFGFSAKTTLSLAQALYEKHKVLTYPRTDSRHLPEDYVSVVQQTFAMLAAESLPGPLQALSAHAAKGLAAGYVKPTRKVFDNTKVSDHFAIIPTLQAPKSLTELEAKLYDLVVKRFIAVFFPVAEFMVTTRITKVATPAGQQHFQTNGKVLVTPGWLAVYGKEVQDEDANLSPVQPAESVQTAEVALAAQITKPPARYNEGTLLSAMEGAGKLIDDDELREAMAEKGLGTPATRAAIIEGFDRGKVFAARWPGFDCHRQSLPAHDAAARPGRGRPHQARADRPLGARAGGDGARQALPREIHARHCGYGRAHRQKSQGLRPGHHPRRLRHPESPVPELRRAGEGKLPPLCLHRRARR